MMPNTQEELRTVGYALVPQARLALGDEQRRMVGPLAAEWDHLETDRYLQDGATFRERRYDRFYFVPATGEVRLRPHRPYFQSDDANGYAGGIHREVAALRRTTLDNPLLTRLIRFDFARFPVADGRLAEPWDVQCHQFRILGSPDQIGEPTPEGPHRDEVHYGAIHLMQRTNAVGGESMVYSPDKELLTQFCLTDQMDTMYWADEQVLHAVQPITAKDPEKTALRDVLIFGYKHSPGLRPFE